MFIHGTKDADVPFDKSVDMAQRLAQHGVPHQRVPVPDAGHGLDDGDPVLVQAARQKTLAFIQQYLSVS
jgi:dipeptidyl aminopeptidase/acylaminoacyl peptidase